MEKVNKKIYVALIFILFAQSLFLDNVYPRDISVLRIPAAIDEKRIQDANSLLSGDGKINLNDPELTAIDIIPILRKLPSCLNARPKKLELLAKAIIERRLSAGGAFVSFEDLSGINGLGPSRIAGLKKMCSLTRISGFTDPLLQRKPYNKEQDAFHRRYKFVFVEDPGNLVPVAGFIGYFDFSQESLKRFLTAGEQKMKDFFIAAQEGRETIFPMFTQTELRDQLKDAYDNQRQDSRLAYKLFHVLPEHEKRFFIDSMKIHLSPEDAENLIAFFSAKSAEEYEKARALYLSLPINIHNHNASMGVFLSVIRFYKQMDVKRFYSGLEQFSYLADGAIAEKGIVIPDVMLVGFYLSRPPARDRDIQPWLQTEEGKAYMDALLNINPFLKKVPAVAGWPRDRFAYLASDLKIGIMAEVNDNDREFLSALSFLEAVPTEAGLHHGGAVIPGYNKSRFLLVSEVIDEAERRALAWKLRDQGIPIYSLPEGFSTIENDEKRYWVAGGHIDCVINCIDSEFTEDGKARLLIDPFYYRGIKDRPEFKRLLIEQGFTEDMIVVIDESDTGLNLTNFTMIMTPSGKKQLVFNGGSATLKRLGLKEGAFVEITPPIRNLARHGGFARCLTQLFPSDLVPMQEKPDIKINLPPMDMPPNIIKMLKDLFGLDSVKDMISRIRDKGLRNISIQIGYGPFVEADKTGLPLVAGILIPPDFFFLGRDLYRALQEIELKLSEVRGEYSENRAFNFDIADNPVRSILRQEAHRIYNEIVAGQIVTYDDLEKAIAEMIKREVLNNRSYFETHESWTFFAPCLAVITSFESHSKERIASHPSFHNLFKLMANFVLQRQNCKGFFEGLDAYMAQQNRPLHIDIVQRETGQQL